MRNEQRRGLGESGKDGRDVRNENTPVDEGTGAPVPGTVPGWLAGGFAGGMAGSAVQSRPARKALEELPGFDEAEPQVPAWLSSTSREASADQGSGAAGHPEGVPASTGGSVPAWLSGYSAPATQEEPGEKARPSTSPRRASSRTAPSQAAPSQATPSPTDASPRASGRSRASTTARPTSASRGVHGERPVSDQPARGTTRRGGAGASGRGRSRTQAEQELAEKKRKLNGFHLAGILAPVCVTVVGAVIGLALFARPTISKVENRTLTSFPQITLGSFLDGSFFTDLSLWYSDTYPLRETLVSADLGIQSLYGIQPSTQLIGGNRQADVLPVIPDDDAADAQAAGEQDEASDAGDQAAAGADGQAAATSELGDAAQDAAASAAADETKAAEEDPIGSEPVVVPDERVMAEGVQNAIMDGLYVKDGAAYNIYYFAQDCVERYALAINTAADRLEGHARVFSILVPNSSGALLDQAELDSLGGSDPRTALRYFYSLYDDNVNGVFIFDTLREHNSEYIYFRTDHHWTQLGAYYAYLDYCEKAGIEPVTLEQHREVTFAPFLGSYYLELGLPAMEANPDAVIAYYANGTNSMVYWSREGTQVEGEVILDTSGWDATAKADCFIEGDQPLSLIENPTITDGSQVLLIKDSFGCFFAPFLIDNYSKVWIIDFRYFEGNIVDFALEQGIQDVIFLNNMTLAGTEPVSTAILAEVS